MSEYIVQVANELPDDAVGMWQIVPGGRYDFGLDGDALTEFVRRCIAELLSRGAVPAIGGGQSEHEWIVQRRYGSRPEGSGSRCRDSRGRLRTEGRRRKCVMRSKS
jgi:hypothetical protein